VTDEPRFEFDTDIDTRRLYRLDLAVIKAISEPGTLNDTITRLRNALDDYNGYEMAAASSTEAFVLLRTLRGMHWQPPHRPGGN
jgi:hypothetical protein